MEWIQKDLEGCITKCYIKSLRIWNDCCHTIIRRPHQRFRSCRLCPCPNTKCPIRQWNSCKFAITLASLACTYKIRFYIKWCLGCIRHEVGPMSYCQLNWYLYCNFLYIQKKEKVCPSLVIQKLKWTENLKQRNFMYKFKTKFHKNHSTLELLWFNHWFFFQV